MNETVCDNLIESVKWTEPGRLVSLAVLEFINILVIVGNCLVIAAVFCSNKLRSVTNYFIVNLAVADLLVGLAVLPFSATWEVYKVWIFGDVWCRVWLAVDVWMCTASILNLCAISLDRYVAVTRPVTYPSIMSTKKAKSLIAGIWVLSFVICFPPLVGWKDQKPDTNDMHYSRGNVTLYFATSEPPIELTTPEPCPWKCELTNDRGYVLYSALGSFYIPMFVMLFFYWRIYRAAVRTTRAINQGFKTTKGCKGTVSHPLDETTFTLRIHRGRSSKSEKSTGKTDSIATDSTTVGGSLRESNMNRKFANRTMSGSAMFCKLKQQKDDSSIILTYPFVRSPRPNEHASSSLTLNEEPTANAQSTLLVSPKIKKTGSSKRGPKFQVRRFRMETKAAKTLAIIVGGFIICWLPFFSMYLVRAFCEDCIQPLLFSILFWLGYCNSAINPFIYALFSNEFRIAFKRILFRCVCSRSAFRAAENFQMVAARACLVPINFHQTISECNQHETDDFDWQLLPPSPLTKNQNKTKVKQNVRSDKRNA